MGLAPCRATSPAYCDTSGTAVSRRNASNSRSLPGWIVGLKTRMITAFSSLGQLGAGGRQPHAGDGHHQGDPAAAQEQQQRGQGLLANVMSQLCHNQRVWQ
jgi:hypothetical protein